MPVTVTHRSALPTPLQTADQPETKTVAEMRVAFPIGSLGYRRSGPFASRRRARHDPIELAGIKLSTDLFMGSLGSRKSSRFSTFKLTAQIAHWLIARGAMIEGLWVIWAVWAVGFQLR